MQAVCPDQSDQEQGNQAQLPELLADRVAAVVRPEQEEAIQHGHEQRLDPKPVSTDLMILNAFIDLHQDHDAQKVDHVDPSCIHGLLEEI